MSVSPELVHEFQATARARLEALVTEFRLRLELRDDLTFALIGDTLEIRLYVYPSHIPSVNVALFPKGDSWDKWRKESSWGAAGIWLAHLGACREAEVPSLDGRFQTVEELRSRIDALVFLLRDIGRDLLRGDLTDLPRVIAYIDRMVSAKTIR